MRMVSVVLPAGQGRSGAHASMDLDRKSQRSILLQRQHKWGEELQVLEKSPSPCDKTLPGGGALNFPLRRRGEGRPLAGRPLPTQWQGEGKEWVHQNQREECREAGRL